MTDEFVLPNSGHSQKWSGSWETEKENWMENAKYTRRTFRNANSQAVGRQSWPGTFHELFSSEKFTTGTRVQRAPRPHTYHADNQLRNKLTRCFAFYFFRELKKFPHLNCIIVYSWSFHTDISDETKNSLHRAYFYQPTKHNEEMCECTNVSFTSKHRFVVMQHEKAQVKKNKSKTQNVWYTKPPPNCITANRDILLPCLVLCWICYMCSGVAYLVNTACGRLHHSGTHGQQRAIFPSDTKTFANF